jgi:hypothetical protein
MKDDLAWVPTSTQRPHDFQQVYARAKSGTAQKVVFHALPTPRWVSPSIVYQFDYFQEWAPRVAKERALKRSA